jgi:serine/threonine protein kinase
MFPNHCYKYITECYGITREPNTLNYALVFKLKDCSLRDYLDNHYNSLTLKNKLDIIERICLGLNCIHSYNIIHRDLHSGNILHSFEKISDISISDFGLCRPAGEIRSEKKIYGIVPYIAPEVLRGNEYTQASDIYSLGIIINEIITVIPPFNDQPHDHYLALDICRGLRPTIRAETPDALKELIESGENYDEVITIGPLIMMKFVVATTKPFGVKTVVSMNPIMIDGTGMCGGCRLTVGGKTKFACVDGPDFDGFEVDFDEAMSRGRSYGEFEAHAREAACNLFKKEVK